MDEADIAGQNDEIYLAAAIANQSIIRPPVLTFCRGCDSQPGRQRKQHIACEDYADCLKDHEKRAAAAKRNGSV